MQNSKIYKFIAFTSLVVIFNSYSLKANGIDTLKLKQKITGFKLHNTVPGQPDSVSLQDYKNKKGVVIVFMTNGCYHCILYRDRIKAIQKNYASKGFSLITINPSPTYAPEETFELMQEEAKKGKYDFPYLEDKNQKVTFQFGVRYTPEAYVLLRKGNDWLLQYYGPIDNDMELKKEDRINYLDNVLQALVNHQKVPEYSLIK